MMGGWMVEVEISKLPMLHTGKILEIFVLYFISSTMVCLRSALDKHYCFISDTGLICRRRRDLWDKMVLGEYLLLLFLWPKCLCHLVALSFRTTIAGSQINIEMAVEKAEIINRKGFKLSNDFQHESRYLKKPQCPSKKDACSARGQGSNCSVTCRQAGKV